MLMKIGRLLAMIIHCMVQFILDYCKSYGSDILTIIFIFYQKTSQKRNIFSQHTIPIKFGRPLAIIVHYTVQFNLECCKSSVPDMGPNTILKIIIKIKRRLKSEI